MLDATVGNALRAPELEPRGAALIERSDALRRAASSTPLRRRTSSLRAQT
jgi:hypothetical protein